MRKIVKENEKERDAKTVRKKVNRETQEREKQLWRHSLHFTSVALVAWVAFVAMATSKRGQKKKSVVCCSLALSTNTTV